MIPFRVNTKDVNYVEYTSLSKSVSNCYIIIILLIMLIHSIFPKIMLFGIKENLSILISDRGKLILIISIGALFWANNNKIQTFFTVINFLSFFAMLLCEFIFHSKIAKKYDNKNEINAQEVNISKSHNIDNSLVSQKASGN
jgi:phosphoglycerol transferase MdoB-like AlkP superfamily enzyme